MSDDERLKPCPFCGGEAELTVVGVRCKKTSCASIHNPLFSEKAIETWNRRVQSWTSYDGYSPPFLAVRKVTGSNSPLDSRRKINVRLSSEGRTS